MNRMIPFLKGVHWWGLAAAHGTRFPLTETSEYSYHPTTQFTGNQESPLMVSSMGRYLWSDQPYDVEVHGGVIAVTNAKDDFALYEGYETLRGAFCAAVKAHFPPNGLIPPENFFLKPQYNTWAELIYDQCQENILSYAHGIVDNGYPAGILMIDDGWMRYYGSREFNLARFPDARAMMAELHAMNFDVMLWICPFISPDTAEFRELEAKQMLVRTSDGSVAIRRWWNGYSAILDMSNPETAAWLDTMLSDLMEIGADGFKFDAGDANYYRDDDLTWGNVTAHDQCMLWAKLGEKYRYNEYRACYRCAGLPLVQRLCDKSHRWSEVARLVPDALAQGLLGFAFGCPDMIGGGSFVDFLPGAPSLDQDLFVRYSQTAALMPMMQYSAAPWRVLDADHARLCREAGDVHLHYADMIIALAKEAAVTGEPIIRYMEYVFPHEGFADLTDQFMIGDTVLCAPVTEQGAITRTVVLPRGSWRYCDGTVYEGGCTLTVPAPINVLPVFEKC